MHFDKVSKAHCLTKCEKKCTRKLYIMCNRPRNNVESSEKEHFHRL